MWKTIIIVTTMYRHHHDHNHLGGLAESPGKGAKRRPLSYPQASQAARDAWCRKSLNWHFLSKTIPGWKSKLCFNSTANIVSWNISLIYKPGPWTPPYELMVQGRTICWHPSLKKGSILSARLHPHKSAPSVSTFYKTMHKSHQMLHHCCFPYTLLIKY